MFTIIHTVQKEKKMDAKKCACKGSFLDKFIQPSILLCLHKNPAYGSIIYKRIMEMNLDGKNPIDPTGFYRTLKKMETIGLLHSDWDSIEKDSQKRKIYYLTEEGHACLLNWKNTLVHYHNTIDVLLNQIETALKSNHFEDNSPNIVGSSCCCHK